MHTGATGGGGYREQQTERRRGGSLRSLGVEEVRAETNQGFSLSKVIMLITLSPNLIIN